jgi:hypothetical protein
MFFSGIGIRMFLRQRFRSIIQNTKFFIAAAIDGLANFIGHLFRFAIKNDLAGPNPENPGRILLGEIHVVHVGDDRDPHFD